MIEKPTGCSPWASVVDTPITASSLLPARSPEYLGVVQPVFAVAGDADADLPEILVQNVLLVRLRIHPHLEDLFQRPAVAAGDILADRRIFVASRLDAVGGILVVQDMVHLLLFGHVGRVRPGDLEEHFVWLERRQLLLRARFVRQIQYALLVVRNLEGGLRLVVR